MRANCVHFAFVHHVCVCVCEAAMAVRLTDSVHILRCTDTLATVAVMMMVAVVVVVCCLCAPEHEDTRREREPYF